MALRSLCLNRSRMPSRLVYESFVSESGGSSIRCSMAAVNGMLRTTHQMLRRFNAASTCSFSSIHSVRGYDYNSLCVTKNSATVSPKSTIFAADHVQCDQHHHQQRRCKHSSTQIKRLFRKNPARLRVEKRIWNIDRKQPQVILEDGVSRLPESDDTVAESTNDIASAESTSTALEASAEDATASPTSKFLLYPRVYTPPAKLPNGWFEPMDPALRPTYPFSVSRTKNKPKDSIGFLPVYTKYRKDGTKVLTRIKKVTGDMDVFLRELRIVLSLPQPANQLPAYDAIRIRTGNIIEIQGHRANEVRDWLGGLGF